jgi:Mrp family chromosome partitioning ATPase
MRDKPDSDLEFNKPEVSEQPETPSISEPPEPTAPAEEEQAPPEPAEENGPYSAPPSIERDASFRIKDQFDDLGSIPPAMSRESARPSNKAPLPGAGLAETARPGRTIRRENSFQDFFRNLDIIKIARGVYRRFWVVLLFAFGMLMLFIPIARALKGGVTWSSEAFMLYTKPVQKQVDVPGANFLLRPLTQDTLFDLFFSKAYLKELEETTGIKSLEKNVSFDSKSKSDIIALRINNMPDEPTAVNTINRLAEEIISQNDQYYRRLTAAAYDQYKVRREAEERNFSAAVKAVEEFQLKHRLLELSTQYQNYFASVNAATERLSVSQVAREGLQVRIRNYEKIISELPDEILDEALEVNPLKGRISNSEAALLQARIQYAADNPKILRQERELEELRKLLQSGTFDETRERTFVRNPLKGQLEGELLKLRAEEDVATQQMLSLQRDLTLLQDRFQDLPGLEKEYAALLETRARMDAAFRAARAAEESALLTLQSPLADFKLITPASLAEPSAASLLGKIIPIAGFILGFFGGLFVVLLIELLDAKIRTQLQLEKAYDAPCLASIIEIPRLEEYDSYRLLLPSLREISERLNVVLQGSRAKVLGFFSSLDGEGKSILSFNLARYYSSLNLKVLFVSFDTRPNPCLPGEEQTGWPLPGIEDYLTGKAELEEMIRPVQGMDMISVKELRGDLLDLAKGSAMPRLWDLLRQNYELILTDAPCVLDHTVSGTLAGLQDEIIYVIASPISDRRIADAGLEFLEDRGLAPRALIFNRVNPYYLEDVRQQRIIRSLAEKRNPLADLTDFFSSLLDRFSKPGARAEETPGAEEPAWPLEEPGASLPDLPDDGDLPEEDEELPELIGLEEPAPEPQKENTPPVKEKPAQELSFRDWLGDPEKRDPQNPEDSAEDHEK